MHFKILKNGQILQSDWLRALFFWRFGVILPEGWKKVTELLKMQNGLLGC